jgi:chromosome segregation ATPase
MSTDNADRLSQISAELAGILEGRISELMAAMRAAEQNTRKIVSTELEIARYRQLEGTLSTEMGELAREVKALESRLGEVRMQHSTLVEERDRLREQVSRLERDVRSADSQIEESRTRLRSLEEESEALRRENGELKGKTRTLEENVARMRKLKEELMTSLSGLTQQMSSLNLGAKD